MERYPDIIDQKDNIGNTGYDYLDDYSRKLIAEFLDKNKLKIRKPEGY